MKSKIIKQEKNPFLEREKIILEIKAETTPNADEVKSAIGKDPTLTIVKKINTNFGNQTFIAEALVYNNIETKNKIETIPQKTRKKMGIGKKTEAKPTKKEETVPEPKPEPQSEETKPEEQTE